MHRKKFIKTTGITSLSLAVASTSSLFATHSDAKARLVMIGVGLRGQDHLDLLLRRNDVELIAILMTGCSPAQ